MNESACKKNQSKNSPQLSETEKATTTTDDKKDYTHLSFDSIFETKVYGTFLPENELWYGV